jgi:hypothetical protein
MDVIISGLADWDSFYVIVGSAAGALIGLQFVVLTLIAQRPIQKGAADAGAAFATPTIFHFGVVLLLSALLRAPWQMINIPAAILTIVGIIGAGYTAVVAIRMQKQSLYRPNPKDWLSHVILPFTAYAVLIVSSFAALSQTGDTLFGMGAAVLLLLFVGIHNAWDNVAYVVFVHQSENE